MAQWIRHLTTNQGIPGSSPGRVGLNFSFFLLLLFVLFFVLNFSVLLLKGKRKRLRTLKTLRLIFPY